MNAQSKNIVFDWNSTLLDDIHAMHQCTNHLLESEGHSVITIDDFRSHYAIPLERFYMNLGFGEDQVAKLMTLEGNSFHKHYEPLANRSVLRHGAREILEHTKYHGVHTLILSNHVVDPIRLQLQRFEIEHFFAEVLAYASHAVQFKDMTKGERLRRYMAERGMTPRQTIIVGDSIEEIHIAQEQGLISVAITGGCASEERLRAEKPDYVVHSLQELKPILQEQGFVS